MRQFTVKIPISIEEKGAIARERCIEIKMNGPDESTADDALRAFSTKFALVFDPDHVCEQS